MNQTGRQPDAGEVLDPVLDSPSFSGNRTIIVWMHAFGVLTGTTDQLGVEHAHDQTGASSPQRSQVRPTQVYRVGSDISFSLMKTINLDLTMNKYS